jgi:hypothetical protein
MLKGDYDEKNGIYSGNLFADKSDFSNATGIRTKN